MLFVVLPLVFIVSAITFTQIKPEEIGFGWAVLFDMICTMLMIGSLLGLYLMAIQ